MAGERKPKSGSPIARSEARPSTLHEILVAWQAGRLTARQAMALAGLDGFPELYEAARSSGVPLRKTLLPAEKRAADLATAAIRRRWALESKDRG